jgi:hypothetical protein
LHLTISYDTASAGNDDISNSIPNGLVTNPHSNASLPSAKNDTFLLAIKVSKPCSVADGVRISPIQFT